MTTIRTLTAALTLGVAATCFAPQAFARPHAISGFEANAQAIGPELAARAAAAQRGAIIRACNEAAAPFREYTWGNEQSDRYRACMAEHGQTE